MTDAGALQGLVRILRDLTAPSDNPFLETVERDGDTIIVATVYRIIRKGTRYRTEWIDGTPRRLFDGSTVWDYPVDDPAQSLPRVNDGSKRSVRPFLVDLPPVPIVPGAPELEPIVQDIVEDANLGEMVRLVFPTHALGDQVGYTFLVDRDSGWVRRQWYGTSSRLLTSWSRIEDSIGVPDEAFRPGSGKFKRANLTI